MTITEYGPDLEPHLPPLEERLAGLRALAGMIGRKRIAWRYDPIIISSRTDFAWHERLFARLLEHVAPYVDRVVISFVDYYRQARRRLRPLIERGWEFIEDPRVGMECGRFFGELAARAGAYGLPVFSCCEPGLSAPSLLPKAVDRGAVHPGACIDVDWLHARFGLDLNVGRDRGQRPGCRCARSVDIGWYDSCRFGCRYCYASRRG
jgi:DNA repair photolyase